MKTVDELLAYFDTELRPDLRKVENKRRRLVFFIFFIGFLALAAIAGLVFLKMEIKEDKELNELISWGWIVFGWLISLVFAFVGIYQVSRNRGFYYDFKNLVIDRIIQFIDASFVYKAHKKIPVNRFVESYLFQHMPTKKYDGDDYVRGTLENGIKVEFSEVVARYRPMKGEASKKDKTPKILFKGLFFIAEMDRKFESVTMIVPAGRNLERAHFAKQLPVKKVTVDHPKFNQTFSLFSDSSEDRNRFITPELLTELAQFKENTGHDIQVSFVGRRVFVGISYEEDLFEPNIYKSLMDFSVIQDYFATLAEALSIIERINPAAEAA